MHPVQAGGMLVFKPSRQKTVAPVIGRCHCQARTSRSRASNKKLSRWPAKIAIRRVQGVARPVRIPQIASRQQGQPTTGCDPVWPGLFPMLK